MTNWDLQNGYRVSRYENRAANVYLVTTGMITIMVDTGSRKNVDIMIDKINEVKGRNKLKYLLLTHTHYDHCLNAELIRDIYEPDIIVGESEREFLENGFAPLPDGTNPWSRFVVKIGRSLNESFFSFKPVKSNLVITSEYTIPEHDIKILPTPGHTYGSLSLIVGREIAIVGDTMFNLFRKTIFPPFADDTDMLMDSWRNLLDTGCSLFLPAHGSEISSEVVEKEYLNFSR